MWRVGENVGSKSVGELLAMTAVVLAREGGVLLWCWQNTCVWGGGGRGIWSNYSLINTICRSPFYCWSIDPGNGMGAVSFKSLSSLNLVTLSSDGKMGEVLRF